MFQNMVKPVNSKGGSGAIDEWENESPTSNFTAQTIPLNMTGASLVAIKQRMSTSNDAYVYGCIDIEGGETSYTVKNDTYTMRTYTVASDGVQVSIPGAGQGNTIAIPVFIKVF